MFRENLIYHSLWSFHRLNACLLCKVWMVGKEKIKDQGCQQLVFVSFPHLPFNWILPTTVRSNINGEENTRQKKGHSYCPMKHSNFKYKCCSYII